MDQEIKYVFIIYPSVHNENGLSQKKIILSVEVTQQWLMTR